MKRPNQIVEAFDPTAQTFSTVLLGPTNGSCVDGTVATACNADISDAYADANGQFYYVERGKIRTIDQSGNVQTLMGAGLNSGDGGLATMARMGSVNDVKLWNDGSNDRVVIMDNTQFRIRDFPIGGNISLLAGNGSNGSPNTTGAAAGQPLIYSANGGVDNMYIQVHPTTGDVYSGSAIQGYITKLPRATGIWTKIVGNFSGTLYTLADGLTGLNINLFGSYSPKVIGFDGTSNLLVHKSRFSASNSRDAFLKVYDTATGTQSHVAGIVGVGTYVYSADGTAGTSTNVSLAESSGAWDAFSSRWAFLNGNAERNLIRTQTVGGAIGTIATLSNQAVSFAYRHDASNNVIYYCDSNSFLRKYNVTTTTDTALTWPIAKMKCVGHGMVYSSSRNSLIFPFTQDGIGGVAEYFNP
jgi:hypothetical protein